MTAENNASEILTCDWCGAIIEDDCIEVDGHRFDDAECAEAMGYRECETCGEWFRASDEGSVYIDGHWFCDEDCAHDGGWERCIHCGSWVKADDAIWPDDGNAGPYCDGHCAESDNYSRCEVCGDWVSDRYGYWVNTSDGEQFWCDSCRDYGAHYCDGCDELWADDDFDGDYCPNCCHAESSYLHEYGYRPYIQKYGDGGPTLGTELETDASSYADRGAYCDDLAGINGFNEHFWLTEDGSLDNGVEITSQPMTLSYHVKIRDMYEEISDTANLYGFRSHDAGTCGLHINIGSDFFGKTIEAKELAGYKLLRLCQRFEKPLMTFSRRTNDRWCHYHTSCDFTPKKDEKVSVLKAQNPNAYDSDEGMFDKARKAHRGSCHSDCVNLGHISQRIEVRIFRGTLKWSTYYASLALVEGMCHIVKNHGTEYLESLDWYSFIEEAVERCAEPFAKQCLVDYLDEKGLL